MIISKIRKKLSCYTDLVLLNELIKRNPTMKSPIKTSWGEGMLEASVAVGNDETAFIFLHKDAIEFMDKEK